MHFRTIILLHFATPSICGTICSEVPQICSGVYTGTSLELASRGLTGTLPPYLYANNLVELHLAGNNLSGSIPMSWSGLGSVTEINLGHNRLSGTVPVELGLPLIRHAYLSYNRLSGTLPAGWDSLRSLAMVDLSSCSLSGTLPSKWSTLESLSALYLPRNRLSGTLPPEWSELESATWMRLYRNSLSGTLPIEWGSLVSMTGMELHDNFLSGTLPSSEWSHFESIASLTASNNHLSGSLPSEWSSFTSIQDLFLDDNHLSGTLPAEWASLQSLRGLFMSSASLSGTLPEEWGKLSSTFLVHLESNSLSGTLPLLWSSLVQRALAPSRQGSLAGLFLFGNAFDEAYITAQLASMLDAPLSGMACPTQPGNASTCSMLALAPTCPDEMRVCAAPPAPPLSTPSGAWIYVTVGVVVLLVSSLACFFHFIFLKVPYRTEGHVRLWRGGNRWRTHRRQLEDALWPPLCEPSTRPDHEEADSLPSNQTPSPAVSVASVVPIPGSLPRSQTPSPAVSVGPVVPILATSTPEINRLDVKLLQKLGAGAQASVHEGRWLGTAVAVKVVHQGSKSRLRHEVEMLTKLRHPCVCSFFGMFSMGNDLGLVIELLDSSVFTLLHHSRADVKPWLALRISHETAMGIAFLHRNNCIHRDIKSANVRSWPHLQQTRTPSHSQALLHHTLRARRMRGYSRHIENAKRLHVHTTMHTSLPQVMLDHMQHAKICDFGIAVETRLVSASAPSTTDLNGASSSSGVMHTANMGTLRYMAPEVLWTAGEDRQKYDERCDVYSFGMFLWEVMHREVPFSDYDGMYVAKILAPSMRRPPLSLGVGFEEFEQLISVCWHHDPAQRPPMVICAELLEAMSMSTPPEPDVHNKPPETAQPVLDTGIEDRAQSEDRRHKDPKKPKARSQPP